MNHLFEKNTKKSLKSSQQAILLGINVAASPLGLRAELEIGPKGKRLFRSGS